MNLRYNINERGEIHLEQLLQFKASNGDKINSKWERVPITGASSNETWGLPLGMNCGVFFFESNIKKYYGHHEAVEKSHYDIVSALSINSITEHEDNKTRINVGKNFFIVNISILEFIPILNKMLSNHQIINVDLAGDIMNT